jgi:hypothetical protein
MVMCLPRLRSLEREIHKGFVGEIDREPLRAQIEAHVERRFYLVLATQVASFVGLALLILFRT